VENRVATIFELAQEFGNPGRVLDELGVVENTVFRKVPKQCMHCECKKFDTLELVGISDKPLFYECVACGTLHLKYTRGWVEKQFTHIEGLWTNPNDWEEPDDLQLYN
jgi:hypothetical protein|tara:strand:+ start:1696 stop:2019 length:324 start_codon:yes stop_codon:yes gene_type:complete